MNTHIIVCPFNGDTLSRLAGGAVVVNIADVYEIERVYHESVRFKNKLHCVRVYTDIPLDCIEFRQEWRDIPVALYAPTLGRFTQFVRLLPILRQLNIRVYLPVATSQDIIWLRVLSSLGISTAINFDDGVCDWDALCDLMTYALLGRVPHATIEPFTYIATHYAPNQRTDFGAVYLDDPSRSLHMDDTGCVALTNSDLLKKDFIADDIRAIGDITQNERYNQWQQSWRQVFLRPDGCAWCGGWRLCQGRFHKDSNDNAGCKKFFIELMDIAKQHQDLRNKKRELWQL
ncbi:MAG: hypothetical protein HQL03_02325 [Nitrospirae bacterium]|nr:hypothetical protein [Nitrospirota bacterium]